MVLWAHNYHVFTDGFGPQGADPARPYSGSTGRFLEQALGAYGIRLHGLDEAAMRDVPARVFVQPLS